jgi:cell division protein FtsB
MNGAGPGGRPPGAPRESEGSAPRRPLAPRVPPGPPGQARLTSRAAVLAVVICAVALSLAYPVREYVAQRQTIDQLVAEQQMMRAQISRLLAERDQLNDPAYIEQLAETSEHMCFPGEQCYIVENGHSVLGAPPTAKPGPAPWYAKLWQSVKQANEGPGKK